MLVSSIGYFDAKLNNNYADNSMKNQPSKTNLSEGFGKNTVKHLETVGFMKKLVRSIKSLFVKDKTNDSSKSLSLIA